MENSKFKRTKLACYTAYFTMSSIFSLPPVLFVCFRQMYGISYTLLGTLILINFVTQLAVDLIFTMFSKRFNVKKVVRVMPLITSLGLAVYSLVPMLAPKLAYVGLVTGTVIFSLSAGLSEVLLSPLIAAIPSKNPQRDMSFLHSLYAFGVFTVVVISTLFLRLAGNERWSYLGLFWAALPLLAAALFMISPIPDMSGEEAGEADKRVKKRTVGLVLCVACIFFGSCAENVMSNWISGYMEKALSVDKTLGDILGVAIFAVLLGTARILYAKFGRNIFPVLLLGMSGAAVCYVLAGISSSVAVAFGACILTGLLTAMLWPGMLIMMEENLPGAGVAAYALMAAGGDLGAAVAPQLMGIMVDAVSVSSLGGRLGAALSLTAEQVGMKAGMLTSALFPIAGAVLLIAAARYFKTANKGRD